MVKEHFQLPTASSNERNVSVSYKEEAGKIQWEELVCKFFTLDPPCSYDLQAVENFIAQVNQ